MRWLLLLGWLSWTATLWAETESFYSTALGQPLRYSIDLPPDAESAGPWPVIYLLHGVGDNENAWPNLGRVEETMHRLRLEGLPPMVVVMPAAERSWYVDSANVGGPGNYASAIRDDLRLHIEATYPVLTERRGRFIAGHSMGGFGALRLALAHPEHYAATAALSTALWSHVTPQTQLPERQQRIFDGAFGHPWRADLFLQQHPRAYLDQQHTLLPSILLTAGDDDYFGAYRSSFELFLQLRERKIPVELRITDGGHRWAYWRQTFPEAVRFFAKSFNTFNRD